MIVASACPRLHTALDCQIAKRKIKARTREANALPDPCAAKPWEGPVTRAGGFGLLPGLFQARGRRGEQARPESDRTGPELPAPGRITRTTASGSSPSPDRPARRARMPQDAPAIRSTLNHSRAGTVTPGPRQGRRARQGGSPPLDDGPEPGLSIVQAPRNALIHGRSRTRQPCGLFLFCLPVCIAGCGLIQDPPGKYARRSMAVSSTRLSYFAEAPRKPLGGSHVRQASL